MSTTSDSIISSPIGSKQFPPAAAAGQSTQARGRFVVRTGSEDHKFNHGRAEKIKECFDKLGVALQADNNKIKPGRFAIVFQPAKDEKDRSVRLVHKNDQGKIVDLLPSDKFLEVLNKVDSVKKAYEALIKEVIESDTNEKVEGKLVEEEKGSPKNREVNKISVKVDPTAEQYTVEMDQVLQRPIKITPEQKSEREDLIRGHALYPFHPYLDKTKREPEVFIGYDNSTAGSRRSSFSSEDGYNSFSSEDGYNSFCSIRSSSNKSQNTNHSQVSAAASTESEDNDDVSFVTEQDDFDETTERVDQQSNIDSSTLENSKKNNLEELTSEFSESYKNYVKALILESSSSELVEEREGEFKDAIEKYWLAANEANKILKDENNELLNKLRELLISVCERCDTLKAIRTDREKEEKGRKRFPPISKLSGTSEVPRITSKFEKQEAVVTKPQDHNLQVLLNSPIDLIKSALKDLLIGCDQNNWPKHILVKNETIIITPASVVFRASLQVGKNNSFQTYTLTIDDPKLVADLQQALGGASNLSINISKFETVVFKIKKSDRSLRRDLAALFNSSNSVNPYESLTNLMKSSKKKPQLIKFSKDKKPRPNNDIDYSKQYVNSQEQKTAKDDTSSIKTNERTQFLGETFKGKEQKSTQGEARSLVAAAKLERKINEQQGSNTTLTDLAATTKQKPRYPLFKTSTAEGLNPTISQIKILEDLKSELQKLRHEAINGVKIPSGLLRDDKRPHEAALPQIKDIYPSLNEEYIGYNPMSMSLKPTKDLYHKTIPFATDKMDFEDNPQHSQADAVRIVPAKKKPNEVPNQTASAIPRTQPEKINTPPHVVLTHENDEIQKQMQDAKTRTLQRGKPCFPDSTVASHSNEYTHPQYQSTRPFYSGGPSTQYTSPKKIQTGEAEPEDLASFVTPSNSTKVVSSSLNPLVQEKIEAARLAAATEAQQKIKNSNVRQKAAVYDNKNNQISGSKEPTNGQRTSPTPRGNVSGIKKPQNNIFANRYTLPVTPPKNPVNRESNVKKWPTVNTIYLKKT